MIRIRSLFLGLSVILALFLPVPRSLVAHIRLIEPNSRSSEALKTGPCGGLPRGKQPTIFYAGQVITVEWDEYIDHPGHYLISFSMAGDKNFVVLLDNIPDRTTSPATGYHYKSEVTLPGTPTATGTLQLIQIMTDHPAGSDHYFACADIQLVAPPPPFKRGDANQDGQVDIADVTSTLEYLFGGSPGGSPGGAPACPDAVDTNNDGQINLGDPIATLFHLFLESAPPIPVPGAEACGLPAPIDLLLGCGTYQACGQ